MNRLCCEGPQLSQELQLNTFALGYDVMKDFIEAHDNSSSPVYQHQFLL